jgi:hypothetical protein
LKIPPIPLIDERIMPMREIASVKKKQPRDDNRSTEKLAAPRPISA